MKILTKAFGTAILTGLIAVATGCEPDSAQDRATSQSSPPGNRMSDANAGDSGPDQMLKSLGVGGSGVGASSAAIPENSYVATTNPSSAEEAAKPKKDSASQPSIGSSEKPATDSTSQK